MPLALFQSYHLKDHPGDRSAGSVEMMTLRELRLRTDYRTQDSSPTEHFYVPCLGASVRYVRAAGYFRSSILALVGPAYIDFACRGGKATLVCSPDLEPSDVAAIAQGEADLEARVRKSIARDVDALLASKDMNVPVTTLATLVAHGALQVLVAFRPDAAGIYHEKIGCFTDAAGNVVSFIGSANETYSAWAEKGNFESIEVFCSWDSDKERDRTLRHQTYLASLIEDRVEGLKVIRFPEAEARKLFERGLDSLDALKPDYRRSKPKSRSPLPHQIEAIASWKAAGSRGILQHATGSGKTFTAIMAMAEHTSQGLPALVLVPSTLLQDQWKREILEEMPKASVLLAGGGNDRWRDRMALEAQTGEMDFPDPRITIAVMATASSAEFVAKVDAGPHLLVVADEVHQVGSTEFSRVLRIDAGKRLGLSATPTRYGDPEGTERIFKYFGGIVQPVITLKDAIAAGRLVNYEYQPLSVRLDTDESLEWNSLTKRIGQCLSQQSDVPGAADEVQRLLIRRSRIAKKASAKAPLAAEIVSSNFSLGQRWLVYCEDVDHMERVAAEMKLRGITPTLYYSAMEGEKARTLQWFSDTGGVILAVRCLDEGIDIPSVSHALILASSQNPRQFVQRRGRILRKAPGKHVAVLYDVLVLPVDDEDDPIGALESEFARAVEFANDAMNSSAHAKLLSMAVDHGIDITSHYQTMQEAE